MRTGPSFFNLLRDHASVDPDTSIMFTLDVAPGPGEVPLPLLSRSDGPSCGKPVCHRSNVHARAYRDPSALEFSQRVRFTEQITGYAPSRAVRRAMGTLTVPLGELLFYTSDEVKWTDVLQRAPIDSRIQEDLDFHGRQIAVFEIPHEPDAVGLVIRHTLLEDLETPPQLEIVVINSPPAVPVLWEEPPAPAKPRLLDRSDVRFLIVAVLAVVGPILTDLL